MLLTAPEGQGCWFCEHGRPVEHVESRAGNVALCLECVLRWFPGRSADWWEARHAPLRDHLGDRLKEAIQQQYYAALAHRLRLERQEAQDAQDPADGGG